MLSGEPRFSLACSRSISSCGEFMAKIVIPARRTGYEELIVLWFHYKWLCISKLRHFPNSGNCRKFKNVTDAGIESS
jgi:hypothetical protein